VARWGAFRHLAVFEFWNEYDHLVEGQGVSSGVIASWHQEMARYLAELDPYDHIITTSLSHNDFADLWELPEMQFSQRHLYGSTNGLHETHLNYEQKYNKPFVAGEFSLDWVWPPTDTPAAYGREVHMALWRGLFSPTPILPMTWWWEFHADNNHEFHFQHAATIAALTSEGSGPLEANAANATQGLEVLGLSNQETQFVWVHNRGGGTVSNATFSVGGVRAGATFRVRRFDPWTGAWAELPSVVDAGGSVTIPLLSLGPDADTVYVLTPE
jgi:hypothetical protein